MTSGNRAGFEVEGLVRHFWPWRFESSLLLLGSSRGRIALGSANRWQCPSALSPGAPSSVCRRQPEMNGSENAVSDRL